MSSYYRPPQRQAYNWREREAEARRKAEEEASRKRNEMNETNFPTLSSSASVTAPRGTQFANLARKWAVDTEVDERVAAYKKFQEAADQRDTERILSHRSQYSRHERHDDEYEEDLAAVPEEIPASKSAIDADGHWAEVTRGKRQKPKRELTVEELDERARKQDEDERREDDFNGHLFESNRHDHDRV